MPKKKMTLARKNAFYGRMFVLPFVIGFLFLFIVPFIQSFIFSFEDVKIDQGLKGTFTGLKNYKEAFTIDPNFVREFVNGIQNMLYQVPLIMVYSIFCALLIKEKFFGRTAVRAVFFLPVIIASGVLMQILKEDVFSRGAVNGQTVYLFFGGGLEGMFAQLGIPEAITAYFNQVIARVFDLTWKSGVQILLFVSGLYSISPQLYEAAKIEGATGWQSLWKVTIPMLSPVILLNLIYSIIDNFTDYTNAIIRMINSVAMKEMRYGYSSALSWIYFLAVLAMIGIVMLLLRKKVFYAAE